jgi:hypothetical protein
VFHSWLTGDWETETVPDFAGYTLRLDLIRDELRTMYPNGGPDPFDNAFDNAAIQRGTE